MLKIKATLAKVLGVFSKMFVTKSVVVTATVKASTNQQFNITPPAIAGYTPIGIYQISNSHGASFPITDFGVASERVVLRNLTNTATDVTITATYLYAKTILCWGGVLHRSIFKAFSRFRKFERGCFVC